jgi:hypothetical protein
MSALSIQVPFPVFQGRDGQPLKNGYIWIGEPNLNPQTNPVVAYYDEALTIVAPQPLRTINGYVSRAGTPAQIYVDAVNFSILVQDSKGSMVYNFPEGTGISPDASGIQYTPAGTGAVATTVQAKLRESVSIADYMTDVEKADAILTVPLLNHSNAANLALAAASRVYIPAGFGCNLLNVFVPANKEIYGNRANSRIIVAAGTTALIAGSDAVLGARSDFIRGINIHDLHIYSTSIAANTIGIRVNQAVSGSVSRINYTKCDSVVYQQCADGFTFDDYKNDSLEDATTDCNYIINSLTTVRNNDCDYTNMIARASKQAIRLDAGVGGQHDGVTMTGNTFFPNTQAVGGDTVFIKNIPWLVVTGNKFFQPGRHGLRIEGSISGGVIADNIVTWAGEQEAGDGISILTTAGAPSGSYGSLSVHGNTIVSPSGHGISITGVQGLNIGVNTVIAPNSQKSFATTSFTKYGIHLAICGQYNVTGNKVCVSLDGRDGLTTPRRWMWDVFIDVSCTNGTVDHQTDLANNSLVYYGSVFTKQDAYVPITKKIPSAINAGNGAQPYSVAGWSVIAGTATLSTPAEAANPIPNSQATAIQIAFGSAVSGVQKGTNQTYAGGQLWATFYAKSSTGTCQINYNLSPNGGTAGTGTFMLDSVYRPISIHVPYNVAAGYSLVQFFNTLNAGSPTIQMVGLDVTTSELPPPPTMKTCYGTAAPAAGTWHPMDRVINSAPTVGQPKSWVCTVFGIPGTWVSEGNL